MQPGGRDEQFTGSCGMSKLALFLAAALYLIAALSTDIPHMRVVFICYAVANFGLMGAA
jgi:hypothetical protein